MGMNMWSLLAGLEKAASKKESIIAAMQLEENKKKMPQGMQGETAYSLALGLGLMPAGERAWRPANCALEAVEKSTALTSTFDVLRLTTLAEEPVRQCVRCDRLTAVPVGDKSCWFEIWKAHCPICSGRWHFLKDSGEGGASDRSKIV